MPFDFVYAMTDSGVDQKAAERIIKRFQRYKIPWFDCIDSSFVKEEQKIQFKNLIASRLEALLK